MYKLKDFLGLLEQYAPLSLSYKMIEKGSYDNSGIIADNGNGVQKVLFSLDLTLDSVNKAVELGADTIVTHHPAIYAPLKSLSVEGQGQAVLLAIKNGINVISMHLNLDLAKNGIDYSLSTAFSQGDQTILDMLDNEHGYGRKVIYNGTMESLKEKAKEVFKTDKILAYGSGKIGSIATFCGSGASIALDLIRKDCCDVDVIITSDVAHHELLEMIERGKKVLILPHYVSEEYGFNKFYEWTKENNDKIQAYYFDDKRFR